MSKDSPDWDFPNVLAEAQDSILTAIELLTVSNISEALAVLRGALTDIGNALDGLLEPENEP